MLRVKEIHVSILENEEKQTNDMYRSAMVTKFNRFAKWAKLELS